MSNEAKIFQTDPSEMIHPIVFSIPTHSGIEGRTIVEAVDEIPIWVEASMAQGNQSSNFVLHTSNIDRINQLCPRFVPFGFACGLALRLGLTLGGVN